MTGLLVLAALALTWCADIFLIISSVNPEAAKREKADRLITFKETLSAGNTSRAVHMLVAADQKRLLDGEGDLREEYRARLHALRLRSLMNNPDVRIRPGGIAGIFDALEVLKQGHAVEAESEFAIEDDLPQPPDRDSLRLELVHAAAKLLFADIRSGSWQYALNDLHEGSRRLFVGSNGKITNAAKRRLSAIDTSAWRSLSLRDGRLVGVVLIIPAVDPGVEKAASAFFKAVKRKRWGDALGMLEKNERSAQGFTIIPLLRRIGEIPPLTG